MSQILDKISKYFAPKHLLNVEEHIALQKMLLHDGVPATAEILELKQTKSELYEYVYLHLKVLLKIQSSSLRYNFETLISRHKIPSVGQIIHIKYSADDISQTMIVY